MYKSSADRIEFKNLSLIFMTQSQALILRARLKGKILHHTLCLVLGIPTIMSQFSPGDKVKKKSNKPFKSSKKINTIKSIKTNSHTGNPAASFLEDDSVVDLRTLTQIEQKFVRMLSDW